MPSSRIFATNDGNQLEPVLGCDFLEVPLIALYGIISDLPE